MGIYGKRYLYVMASEAGICRVSASTGPGAQLNSLQLASDYALTVIETVQVPVGTASKVKARTMELLKGARVFGEWFKVPPETAVVALRLAMTEITGGPGVRAGK
ncbi:MULTISPECIES: hypothetical protein [Rhizobium]|jgi:hypothetical protein|uniref:hypothetical protein n=1 Tax=Rhizobium TaxID=379 RepID=UPI0010324CFB|nr:hypothetical protein [Rhizobium leguminosarum]NEI66909.1 hypothetical protein [Rhizobium leguminosarum]TAY35880.1 hypothetical protein ELH89_01330 [Rhizobium leguminosarum]